MGLKNSGKREGQGILSFEYDDRGDVEDITSRGGLPLVLETMRALGLDSAVEEHVRLRRRRSGFTETQHIEALVLLLAAGGDCLEDLGLLGEDKALLRLLDTPKLPSPDAARAFLLGCHDPEALAQARTRLPGGECAVIAPENAPLLGLARVNTHLVHRVAAQRSPRVATLERDETIIESRKREARAHYQGGRGYQPSVVYWSEADLIVADEFRDGNVPAGKAPLPVIRRAFESLPATVERRRFRADSACYEVKTLKWLADPANHIERFTVSADMSAALHRVCAAVPDDAWTLLEARTNETVFWAEVVFCPGDWPKGAQPLRTVVRRIQKRQGELFGTGSDRMHLAVVSNDWKTPAAELLAWHYARAGAIEKVHDVVKNELGGGVLPCSELGANAAWWRLCLLTYNVLSALKTLALPPELEDARPKRLRFRVFTVAARVLSHARRLYARVARVVAARAELVVARARLRRLLLPDPVEHVVA